jgi:MerR family copper efflux transcriptional regulator
LKELRTMTTMSIGEVAKRTGVRVQTIRFYEQKGLIEEPPRRSSGYRDYPEGTVSRLAFILSAKELGFTLEEIKELLALRVDPKATCGDVKKQAEAKISEVERKIRTLQRMKKTLVKIKAACDGKRPVGECPILESIDHGEI